MTDLFKAFELNYMAMEQYLQGEAIQSDFNEDEIALEKCKSLTSTHIESETNSSGGFDCNICLDLVQDPVVTFCGHLYCWPCIYRWINSSHMSNESPDHQQPKCPVCKTEVSQKTLIPLYGRGQTSNPSKDEASDIGILVPQRPGTPRCNNMLIPNINTHHTYPIRDRSYVQPSQFDHPGSHMASPMLGLGGGNMHSVDPMIGMFGEMVYARIFGNSETTLFAYPNSYHLAGSNSPRLRRHMIQTDRSLSRVCFFLCCCVILCLLLF